MTMKTAEQIAAEVAPMFPGLNDAFMKVLQGWIAGAIEADRAQRAVTSASLDAMLSAYEQGDGDDVAAFIQAWSDHFTTGAELPDWAVWHA